MQYKSHQSCQSLTSIWIYFGEKWWNKHWIAKITNYTFKPYWYTCAQWVDHVCRTTGSSYADRDSLFSFSLSLSGYEIPAAAAPTVAPSPFLAIDRAQVSSQMHPQQISPSFNISNCAFYPKLQTCPTYWLPHKLHQGERFSRPWRALCLQCHQAQKARLVPFRVSAYMLYRE